MHYQLLLDLLISMYVGVEGPVIVVKGLYNRQRFLRGGGIVEIDKLTTTLLLAEKGKEGSYIAIVHCLRFFT